VPARPETRDLRGVARNGAHLHSEPHLLLGGEVRRPALNPPLRLLNRGIGVIDPRALLEDLHGDLKVPCAVIPDREGVKRREGGGGGLGEGKHIRSFDNTKQRVRGGKRSTENQRTAGYRCWRRKLKALIRRKLRRSVWCVE